MRKFHKLLQSDDALYEKLVPTSEQKEVLVAAKNTIREHLRAGIKEASTRLLKMEHAVEPRFRTQGSWAYGSCVQPAQMPPQEMDWDYGVYLPVTGLDDAGTPRVAAKAYFAVVETLLANLATREGWSMGEEKKHCIRVHIEDGAHVDVAMYAAPENEFENVNDRMVAAKSYTMDAAISLEAHGEISVDQSWDDFEDMMVATREGVWEPSDAEAIAGWFRFQKDAHGEQLQRVWRYLKAWRDQQWKEGGPSSVALMLVTTRHFKKHIGRDDRALIEVTKHLPEALANDIYEDDIDPGHNFNRLETDGRVIARQRAQDLADALLDARTNILQPKSAVVWALRQQWGGRVPNREQDVEHDSPAQQVRDTAPQKVAAPAITSTFAG